MLERFFNEEKPQVATPTLYSVLGVECFADISIVKKAYRQLALIHHPDKGGKEEDFKRIGHAYFVLGDAERKAEYDALLRKGESTEEFIDKTLEEYLDELAESLTVAMKKEFKMREQEKTHVTPSDKPVAPGHPLMQVYYIVGKPINISARAGEFRDEITSQEIQESFTGLDQVILFEDAFLAANYALATRQGDFYEDANCYQSAVAKVKILQPLDGKPYHLHCWINDKYQGQDDGANKFDSLLVCRNAKMDDLELVSANLIARSAKRGAFWKEYDGGEFIPDYASLIRATYIK